MHLVPVIRAGPGNPERTLNSSPIRNTKEVRPRLACCNAYMAVPVPHGLYTACSTWAQPHTSTASVTCPVVAAAQRRPHTANSNQQTATSKQQTANSRGSVRVQDRGPCCDRHANTHTRSQPHSCQQPCGCGLPHIRKPAQPTGTRTHEIRTHLQRRPGVDEHHKCTQQQLAHQLLHLPPPRGGAVLQVQEPVRGLNGCTEKTHSRARRMFADRGGNPMFSGDQTPSDRPARGASAPGEARRGLRGRTSDATQKNQLTWAVATNGSAGSPNSFFRRLNNRTNTAGGTKATHIQTHAHMHIHSQGVCVCGGGGEGNITWHARPTRSGRPAGACYPATHLMVSQ